MRDVEAVAEAWAAMDHKLDLYKAEEAAGKIIDNGGYYLGYLADAAALIKLVAEKGWVLVEDRG